MGIIRRVGGKSKLQKKINSMIPNHEIYVEPFIGGGSIFLYKSPSKINIINDLDEDIINIWKDVYDLPVDIYESMKFIPNRELFKSYLNKKSFDSNYDRLYRNLYLSKVSFSGNRLSYGGDKQGISTAKKIKNISLQLKNTSNLEIYNEDYKTIIKKFDSKDTFFYLDPPYEIETMTRNWGYKNLNVSPQEICDLLKSIKGKFILSYNKSETIENIFKDFYIENVITKYTLGGNGGNNTKNKEELIIKNFE